MGFWLVFDVFDVFDHVFDNSKYKSLLKMESMLAA